MNSKVPPPFLPAILPLLLLLVAAVPRHAHAAEEYVPVAAAVKVENSEAWDGRVFVDAERKVYLVFVPGDPNLYKVDREARKVSSMPRASAMVKKDRCRPIEGVGGLVLVGGLYADLPDGFTFNSLQGKRVAVRLSVPPR
jgi:hypothetical protein